MFIFLRTGHACDRAAPPAEDSGSSWSRTCTQKSSARLSGLDQFQTASHGSEAHSGSASALRLPQQPSQKGHIKGHQHQGTPSYLPPPSPLTSLNERQMNDSTPDLDANVSSSVLGEKADLELDATLKDIFDTR